MQVKLFSDVIDALEKVGKAVLSIKNIPARQRKRYQDAVKDAFTLLNSAVNLVLHRLGDVLLADTKKEFVTELRRLDNSKEWWKLEREVRLCRKLREVHPEIDGFTLTKMPLRLGSRDWNSVRILVDQILEREGELADYISSRLTRFAGMASKAGRSSKESDRARKSISRARKALEKERVRLLSAELQFLKAIQRKR